MNNISITQVPQPGQYIIFHEGEFLKVTLKVPSNIKGWAYLRTSLFNPEKKKKEQINKIEYNSARSFQEWGDFRMHKENESTYCVEIPLIVVGFFEAKAFFLEDKKSEPVWPEGDNLFIKVEPANTLISNSIYGVFTRLFISENKFQDIKGNLEIATELEKRGFNVIPQSGTFRELINKVDFIIDDLGFDIIMLLPIHPTPTTYARMGVYGSPYAALDFLSIDPALAEFDSYTTPLDQFIELIDAVHAKHARVFIDIPIGHTGWASHLQIHHPEFFVKDEKDGFISPGAWGITWEDLSKLNFENKELWKYMAQVFLFWCEKGVDGFRCDAGYMVPENAWEYIVAKVRDEYPSTVFLLEGLGGSISVTESLLTFGNLNWAYSEFFQNYKQHEIEQYFKEYKRISFSKGPLINFSETHDNNRLAAISTEYSMMRNGLLALLSHNGTFAITNGVEWFADEKINVHNITSIKWNNPVNQIDYLKRINNILKIHPSIQTGGYIYQKHNSNCNSVAYQRGTINQTSNLLIIANLTNSDNKISIIKDGLEDYVSHNNDLLTGESIQFTLKNNEYEVTLKPYQISLLCDDNDFLNDLNNLEINKIASEIKAEYLLKLQLIKLFKHKGTNITSDFINRMTNEFKHNPYEFFYECFTPRPPVIKWIYPQDLNRELVVPLDTPILMMAPHYFRFKLKNQSKIIEVGEGFYLNKNGFVSIIQSENLMSGQSKLQLEFEMFEDKRVIRKQSNIYVADATTQEILKNVFTKDDIEKDVLLTALSSNNRSGISIQRGAFSNLLSKYDGLISANLNAEFPDDKLIMLTRLRAWSVCNDFSQEINFEYQKAFTVDNNITKYYFEQPAGNGKVIPLELSFRFHKNDNKLQIKFYRKKSSDISVLPAKEAVKVILRPDIESRNHHEVTKAYQGAQENFPKKIVASQNGLRFIDNDKELSIYGEKCTFTREDEWQYNVFKSIDAERGMDSKGDLFSPGYFVLCLKGNEEMLLDAEIKLLNQKAEPFPEEQTYGQEDKLKNGESVDEILKNSIRQFIVKRNDNKTIIAGYPWFLDWGRDTLICLRGVISAGFIDDAKKIIREFASFEKNGTLPNLIRANDTSNRDTSDAPLWFFVVVNDLLSNNIESFLNKDCNGRKLKEVLLSIVNTYIIGTPNGIKMDVDSGLVYSPSHFTWMDTNYPAGTPRQGYPIEIQALWYNALKTLTNIFPKQQKWRRLANQVQNSITELYIIKKQFQHCKSLQEIYLADCLHSNTFQPAKEAIKDDHLRPNQLFAITLGAIKDKKICKGVLSACEELIIPGAIRSLANRKVDFSIEIYKDTKLISNPVYPYHGYYTGDEDSMRKSAYHNGTAWTWPFPTYIEAFILTFGKATYKNAYNMLISSFKLFNEGCINQLPEILDGDYPHTQKGCYAQAWGITEFYRVKKLFEM